MLTVNDVETEYVGTAALASLLGITGRRVQQLAKEGVIKPEGKTPGTNAHRYRMKETVNAYLAYKDSGERTVDQQALEDKLKKQKLEAEIALKESQAELHEMKTRLFDGSIIEVDQVEDDYKNFLKVFKRLVSSIAPRVAGQLSGYTDAVTIRKIEHDINDDLNRTMEAFVVAGFTPEGEQK